MPRRTVFQLALLTIGVIVWGYGPRIDDARLTWIGLGFFAAATVRDSSSGRRHPDASVASGGPAFAPRPSGRLQHLQRECGELRGLCESYAQRLRGNQVIKFSFFARGDAEDAETERTSL